MRKPPAERPGEPPGRAAGGDFCCDICTNVCAKTKQQSAFNPFQTAVPFWGEITRNKNKMFMYSAALIASRTSKRRVSCLGMSWRRNELITLTLPKSGVVRTVCYVNGFVQPTANTRKGAYPKTITANTEKRLFICFRQRRVKERPEGDISICFCRPRRIGKWASSFSPTAS